MFTTRLQNPTQNQCHVLERRTVHRYTGTQVTGATHTTMWYHYFSLFYKTENFILEFFCFANYNNFC